MALFIPQKCYHKLLPAKKPSPKHIYRHVTGFVYKILECVALKLTQSPSLI